jgi:prepilin-type N-terminal cleavage/methylation domain-containing protein
MKRRLGLGTAGFTLIEMLVAIGLVAVMGIICWRGLSFIAERRAAIEQETNELAQLVRAFAQMESDLAERLPDMAVPPRATTPELPLAVAISPGPDGSAELEILRTVATGPTQSDTVRVLYHLDRRGLVRTTGTDDVLVLPRASRFQIRVSAGGFWLDAAQAQGQVRAAVQPAVQPFTRAGALEIVVDDRDGGRYVKVLAL